MESTSTDRPRVALYSHDTQGLGHLRRNLAVAGAFSRSPVAPEMLLLSGANELRSFDLPPSTDGVTLPGLAKDVDGRYAPQSLTVSLERVVALRAATLRAALESFAPDVVVIDKVARGAFGELEPALESLTARGGTHIVLGLRDILDSPDSTRLEWERERTSQAIERYYDQVWVYGDRRVYDPVLAYELPDAVARKVTFTGYLGQPRVDAPARPDLPIGPGGYVLCTVGGGQDGAQLAHAFVDAARPAGVDGVVLCGPYFPPEALAALQQKVLGVPGIHLVPFIADPGPLLAGARAVISMAGYNTTVEVLSSGVPALFVPRVLPRLEQMVRAERLAALGLADVLHPDRADAAGLSVWMHAHRPRPPSFDIDLGGLDRVTDLLTAIATGPPATAPRVARRDGEQFRAGR